MSYTTHLVCAPGDLAAPAVVMEWLIPPGGEVMADIPLVRLAVAGVSQLVMAPITGVLTEHCVAIGEPLAASDLLAMIEAEEQPFGLSMLPSDEDEEAFAAPSARLAGRPSTQLPGDDALALCAALGLSIDEIPHRRASLTREDVERHVRKELRILATLRDLLDR